jgi:hypothetical protein
VWEEVTDDALSCCSYADKAALDAHGKAPHFKDFGRTLKKEDLVAGAPKLYFTRAVGGYASKL